MALTVFSIYWKRDENGHLVKAACRTQLLTTLVNTTIYTNHSSGRRLCAGGLSCRLRHKTDFNDNSAKSD